MVKFVLGLACGWAAHLHYGEQVIAAYWRMVGGQ